MSTTISLISVIIPTYNRADLLSRAVRSACGQTYANLEILVVDDASSDNTEEVARMLEKEDKRVRYVKRKENGGESSARNTGIRESVGEYIAQLDADDEWLPQKIERQLSLFQQDTTNSTGLVHCAYENVCAQSKKTYNAYPSPFTKNALEQLMVKNTIGHSGVLVKKTYLEKAGLFYDEHKLLKIGPDYELWLRLAQHCHFGYVPEVCFRYYIHPTSATQTARPEIFIQSQEYIFEKHASLYAQHPTQHAQALGRYALRLVLYRQPKRALATFLHALRIRPFAVLYATPLYAISFAIKMLRKKVRGC